MLQVGDPFHLIRDHRVIVCAGAGGVGKTTMSAALAVWGASQGRRTLCLTIDPARRLAQAFGVEQFSGKEIDLSDRIISPSDSGQERGSLTLMMLDPRETFDEVVQSGMSSADVAARILSHKVYDHLAQNLAGTQAYMAMEKVCAVAEDPRWDLVVLDTPPSARVLDFFDAPTKMTQILDSPATRALVTALRGGDRLRPGIVGVGMRAALAGMQRVTGSSLLSDMAELISAMNQLLGGFGQRAARLQEQMTGSEFGYVLVTSPDATVVSDVSELARAMHERGLALDALICNRMSRGVPGEGSIDDLKLQFSACGIDQKLEHRLLIAAEYERERASRQRALCQALVRTLKQVGESPAVSFVFEVEPDHDRSDVRRFTELLREGFAEQLSRAG